MRTISLRAPRREIGLPESEGRSSKLNRRAGHAQTRTQSSVRHVGVSVNVYPAYIDMDHGGVLNALRRLCIPRLLECACVCL